MEKVFIVWVTLALFPGWGFNRSEGVSSSKEDVDSLVVLFSWNTKSALESCKCPYSPSGGLSRRAAIIEREKKSNPHLLLLDLGRIVGGKDALSKLKIYKNMEILGYLGYAAIGVCLSDLRFGRAFWEDIRLRSPVPFVLATLVDLDGNSSAEPFIVKKFGNLKVGVIGITGMSGFVPADLDSTVRSDWILLDPFERTKDVVGSIRREVDIVVLLSDLSGSAHRKLVESIEGIDILISSATNEAFREIWGEDIEKRFGSPKFELKIENTYVYNASVLGRGGGRLGKLKLKLRGEG